MKPVYQTKFGDKNGNCLGACLASIFELDEIPEFGFRSDWYDKFQEFLSQFGLEVITLQIEQTSNLWIPKGYHIINGISPRGIWHSTVGYKGKIVHDPHPDGGEIEEKSWDVFVKIIY